MEAGVHSQATAISRPGFREAWDLAAGQLRSEMSRANFETWVQPLKPLGYADRVFRLGAANTFNQEWVEARLKNRISALLSGMLNEPVTLRVVVLNGFAEAAASRKPAAEPAPEPDDLAADTVPTDPAADPLEDEPAAGSGKSSPRKLMLHRAYGTERARVIQPERGMFVTLYLLQQWLPLIGHSAFTVILAARSMCYWNPKTGELRNTIETEMGELAQRAAVSVRTVKDVLNNDLVRKHFLRYTVRRVMTSNGVRTAGILLQVRMDDPLTPEDQAATDHDDTGPWYLPEDEE